MNHEQFEKAQSGAGFIAALDQSGGSTPKALKLYGIDEDAYSGDERDVRPHARDAHPHHHQPGLQRRPHPRRDPVRDDDGPQDRGPADGRLPVERQGRRAVPQGRQGPGRRGRRRAADEADARPRRPARAGRRQRRLRHQDALGDQACRRRASTPSSTSSSRSAGRSSPPGLVPIIEPEVDIHSPEQGRGRGPAQGRAPRRREPARPTTSRSC